MELPARSVILYQDPKQMNTGHWVAIWKDAAHRRVHFFSSYGGRPDEEKNQWVSAQALDRSGQRRNVLNDGLKQMLMEGWEVHYNDHQFQRVGDESATCGIWVAAFLNSRLTPDEFAINHKTDKEYFNQYFL